MQHSLAVTPYSQHYEIDSAVINVKNLRLRTYIGFNPEELDKRQDITINAEIHYDAVQACCSDDEAMALDYKIITKEIIAHVENGKFRLLEKLTADLLAIAMSQENVLKARLTVDKPNALRFSDSVSITLCGQCKM